MPKFRYNILDAVKVGLLIEQIQSTTEVLGIADHMYERQTMFLKDVTKDQGNISTHGSTGPSYGKK